MMSWKPLIARTVVIAAIVSVFIGGAVFVGMRLAGADPGGPASPNELTYSGVLRNRAGTAPLSGDVTLSFTLRRLDGAACPPVTVSAVASADGAFSAPVSTRLCPNGFFNGNTIHYDVSLTLPSTEAGQLTPDGGVAITPVPYARFADQVGVNNDCPTGYERLVDAVQGFPQDSDKRLCIKQDPRAAPWGNPYDQVVRVGTGATAFWIDRYESSVWSDPNGANDRMLPHFTVSSSDYPPEFPPNGQWSRRLYAFSRYNWNPARYITWFQAHEACRASGKRLPTGNEWIAAARNTPDIADAGVGSCVVSGSPFGVNERANCVSSWGAQDVTVHGVDAATAGGRTQVA